MRCLVTAGPTYEPLDTVRRLTNFSTGSLGCRLSRFLADRGHSTLLLLGSLATYSGDIKADVKERFTTTKDLLERLKAHAVDPLQAVFHIAAVSDFQFGRICSVVEDGPGEPIRSGKIATRNGPVWAELIPTPKIIAHFRTWWPQARLVGWKYEVEGDRQQVVRRARDQIAQFQTDACVANGPAYGSGFGFVRKGSHDQHLSEAEALFAALEEWVRSKDGERK